MLASYKMENNVNYKHLHASMKVFRKKKIVLSNASIIRVL